MRKLVFMILVFLGVAIISSVVVIFAFLLMGKREEDAFIHDVMDGLDDEYEDLTR